jgi:hypothetical protein
MDQLRAFPGTVGKIFPVRKIHQGFPGVVPVKMITVGKTSDAGVQK